METTTYRVLGMTCSHCENSVSTAIGALPTVSTVEVDLDSGRVTVTSERTLERSAVEAAVSGAGYELAG